VQEEVNRRWLEVLGTNGGKWKRMRPNDLGKNVRSAQYFTVV
jgi:hypothetical protein